MKFKHKAWKELVLDDSDVQSYLAHSQPHLWEAFQAHKRMMGADCPRARIALKLMWAEEKRLNGDKFEQSLRSWGYA